MSGPCTVRVETRILTRRSQEDILDDTPHGLRVLWYEVTQEVAAQKKVSLKSPEKAPKTTVTQWQLTQKMFSERMFPSRRNFSEATVPLTLTGRGPSPS